MADDIIQIDKIETEILNIPLVGTSELIMHRFSEKAKRQMLDNMQGRKTPKEIKQPEVECEAALHRIKGGGYGIPSIAFKLATIGGARFYRGVTMASLRQFLFVDGEPAHPSGELLTRVDGDWYRREDVVTVGRGTDLRYRPGFPEWRATLRLIYVKSALTRNSVLSLVDAGGMGVGVLEWRPEKNGTFGTYKIDPTKEIVVENE